MECKPTRHVLSKKSLLLYGCVAFKYHEHLIAGRQYRMRLFVPAESAKRLAVRRVSVVNCHVIVGTVLVRFHVEHFEDLCQKYRLVELISFIRFKYELLNE